MKTLEQQLAEAQALLDNIKLQIENKQKFPLDGTICEVWDDDDTNGKHLAYSDGNGSFKIYSNAHTVTTYYNFKPLEMGLTFSDEIIHSKDITPKMDKQLALCWDNVDTAAKRIRIIDRHFKCTYSYRGFRESFAFDNYQLCTTPVGNLPQWARDMIDACED